MRGPNLVTPEILKPDLSAPEVHIIASWSPISIEAKQMSATNNHDAEFAYGAGQIDSMKALNSGIIYDVGKRDYIIFLCKLGYNKSVLTTINGNSSSSYNASCIFARDFN